MTRTKLIDITNEFKREMHVDLEPVPDTYILEPGGILDVFAVGGDISCLALRLGMLENGRPYVAVWKNSLGQGELRLERDGRNVFD